ncbi:hypothetical protein Y888_07945 [Mixta calida B021323]|uniref:Uncharacterized protein n=1 Tax=Klebsiella pneumoniae TaxID=573 RepID=A0A6G6AQ76_KLEPN|nr:hypothetical protein Y888_07945 [Mixta calida B021323]QID23926.1 hypothetical protein [Klebsiella pneumoniae]UFD97186.1 hypothetical protein [Klebsiella pneumoniae]
MMRSWKINFYTLQAQSVIYLSRQLELQHLQMLGAFIICLIASIIGYEHYHQI